MFKQFLIHHILKFHARGKFLKFKEHGHEVERIQELKRQSIIDYLKGTVKGQMGKMDLIKSYDDFQSLPITTYSDYKEDVENQMATGQSIISESEGTQYIPTSGSTSRIKFIPYTKNFVKEIDLAVLTWIFDLYSTYPQVATGIHYWSMSWIPENQRKIVKSTDDTSILNRVTNVLFRNIMAVDKDIALLPTLKESFEATILQLISRQNLTLISVWSPTFLISIVEELHLNHHEYLKKVSSPHLKRILSKWEGQDLSHNLFLLWPNLKIISCWKTGQSIHFIEKLQSYFKDVQISGKGLWATEGVVTIPLNLENEEAYYLTYMTHFYEFEEVFTKKIMLAYALEVGKKYFVIMSTSSGLLRYRLGDTVECVGHFKKIPKLIFKGRDQSSDMVGEKLSSDLVLHLFTNITQKFNFHSLSLVAINGEIPHYHLLIKDQLTLIQVKELEIWADDYLSEYLHYELARNLKQLYPLKVSAALDIEKLYFELTMSKSMIAGNKKIEILDTKK